MAAPADKTAVDMTGTYVMNSKMSGDTEGILALQGIGWAKRKALGLATVTLTLKHTSHEISVDSVAAGVISSKEVVHLDDTEYDHNNPLWGAIKTKAQKIRVADIDDEQLKEGWVGDEVVEVRSSSEANKWSARQIWGFQDIEVDGVKQRRYFRRVALTHKKGVTYCHMCYDYYPVDA